MRRAAVTLLLVLAAMGLATGNAEAAPAELGIEIVCLKPPIPASPANGLDPGPANPREGDPFDPASGITMYEVYGFAGLAPIDYDPGCNPIRMSWTGLAENLSATAGMLTGLTARLWRSATDGTLAGLIDPIQQLMAHVTGWGLFVPLIGFAIMATGIWFVIKSRRMKMAQTGSGAMTMLLVIAVGVLTLSYPLMVGPAFDKGVGTAIAMANAAMTPAGSTPVNVGDAIASNVQSAILYPTWLNQTFGPENTAAKTEFGTKLFKEGALTRAEQRALDADPTKAEAMIAAKSKAYMEVAKQIKEKYPQAYQYLAGHQSVNALQQAVLVNIGALCATVFLLYGLWRVVYSLALVRIVIGSTPAVALLAQHPSGQHIFWSILSKVWAALVSGVIAGVAASVFLVAGVGSVLSAQGVPMPVKVLALLVLSVVMIRLLGMGKKASRKAGRKLRERHPSNDPSRPDPGAGESPTGQSRASAAARGAATAAAQTAVLGAITGGAVTAGALTFGAAKGAALGVVTTPTSPPPVATVAYLPRLYEPLRIESAMATSPTPGSPPPPPSRRPPEPPRMVTPDRIYSPGEALHLQPRQMAPSTHEGGVPVHHIYTPVVPS